MDVNLERLATDLDGAFADVVRAHQDALFGLALAIVGSREDAEEVTQDAFVRAYRALAEYERSRIMDLRLRSWLAKIAVNLARNRLRGRLLVHRPLDERDDGADLRATPHESVEQAETNRYWTTLLAELPLRYRVPVVLKHVEGLSYEEIAEVLGRPVGTVKTHVHRGIEALQQLVESEGKEVLAR